MDRHFFEFWGQCFLNIAQGQKQIEEMDTLFRQGLEGYNAILSIFQAPNHTDSPKVSDRDPSLTDSAEQNFQATFRDVLALWGVVPKEDFEALSLQHAALERRATEQEQIIQHLKTLLGEKHDGTFSATEKLQGILAEQQAEFQKMMNTLGALFEEKKSAAAGKKR